MTTLHSRWRRITPARPRSIGITAFRRIAKRAATWPALFTTSIAVSWRPPRIPPRWSLPPDHPHQAIDRGSGSGRGASHGRECGETHSVRTHSIRSQRTLRSKKLLFSVAAVVIFVALLAYGSHRTHFRWD